MTDQPSISSEDQLYRLALVLDDASSWLHEAAVALIRIRDILCSGQIKRIDLSYVAPVGLTAILGLDPRGSLEVATTVSAEAASGMFRIIDLMHLTLQERDQFFADLAARVAEQFDEVTDLPPVIDHIRLRIQAEAPGRFVPWGGMELPVAWREPQGSRCLGVASRISSGGAFVAAHQNPQLGEVIELELGDHLPFKARGQVAYVTTDEVRGFGVAFLIDADDMNRLESFLIASARGTPWPERSGRLFERFPVRLNVRYEYRQRERLETTANLSRGGVFLESSDPPAVGSELRMNFLPAGAGQPIEICGRVVRFVLPGGQYPAGAGVEFTEHPAAVVAKITQLLSTTRHDATRRVMIVDDDRFFRTVLSHVFRDAGFEVTEAASGDEALLRLTEQVPYLDAITIDLRMAGISGEEVVERLRHVARDANLAVITVTGTTLDESARRRLFELGVDDIVAKSVPPDQMVSRVTCACARRRLWLANPASLVLEALRLEERQAQGSALSDSESARLDELRRVLADATALNVVRRDQRKHLRLSLDSEADISVGEQRLRVPCYEFSIGDAFLAIDPPPGFGTELMVHSLLCAGTELPVELPAAVSEVYTNRGFEQVGARVQFEALDAVQRVHVRWVFAELRKLLASFQSMG